MHCTATATLIVTFMLAIAAYLAIFFATRDNKRLLAATIEHLVLLKRTDHVSRTPQLEAELVPMGDEREVVHLKVRLRSSEPVYLDVELAESVENACPYGFTPGQEGVSRDSQEESVPHSAWKQDGVRRKARYAHGPLSPADSAVWVLARRGRRKFGKEVHLSVTCHSVTGETWSLSVPVEVKLPGWDQVSEIDCR